VAGSCEQGNEPLRSINDWESLEELGGYQLIKKDCAHVISLWRGFINHRSHVPEVHLEGRCSEGTAHGLQQKWEGLVSPEYRCDNLLRTMK